MKAFSGELERNFSPLATLANSSELLRRAVQVVVCGERTDAGTQALLDAVYAVSLPNRVLNLLAPGDALPAGHPAAGKGLHEGRPAAYVCVGPGLLVACDRSGGSAGSPSTPPPPRQPQASPVAAARCTVDSPVGPLTIAAEGGAVSAIAFGAGGGARPNGGVLAEAARQLTEYFAGARQDFTLPLAPAGTPFRLRVWVAMQAIPYGRTMSYGALARALGTAPRAVGGACGANPIPLVIPCHRVVGAGGALGGFSGGAGCDTKRQLLALERTLPARRPPA